MVPTNLPTNPRHLPDISAIGAQSLTRDPRALLRRWTTAVCTAGHPRRDTLSNSDGTTEGFEIWSPLCVSPSTLSLWCFPHPPLWRAAPPRASLYRRRRGPNRQMSLQRQTHVRRSAATECCERRPLEALPTRELFNRCLRASVALIHRRGRPEHQCETGNDFSSGNRGEASRLRPHAQSFHLSPCVLFNVDFFFRFFFNAEP